MAQLAEALSAGLALLWLLDDIPVRPTSHELNDTTASSETRPAGCLSSKHEASIAQQFAFLCSYSEDPKHVMAVCIEDDIPQSKVILRYAANAGKHLVLQVALERISEVLRDEAQAIGRSSNSERLLDVVVALHRKRILARLRSRHSKTRKAKNRTSLIQRLRTAKTLLPKPSISQQDRLSIARDVDHIHETFELLEQKDSLQEVLSSGSIFIELVKSIDVFLCRHEADLKVVPQTAGIWDAHATEALTDKLRKVSHYVRACSELLKASRRYKNFSQFFTQFEDLQQVNRGLLNGERIEQICRSRAVKTLISRISARRQQPQSELFHKFRSFMSRDTRLHAEIQLMVFYEQNPRLKRPRIIVSNKKSCYLCDLFIRLHGKYHSLGTHGKIYDTWGWPAPERLAGSVDRTWLGDNTRGLLFEMNQEIQLRIEQGLAKDHNIVRYQPLESTIDLCGVLTPSNFSMKLSQNESLVGSMIRRSEQASDAALDKSLLIEAPSTPQKVLTSSEEEILSETADIVTDIAKDSSESLPQTGVADISLNTINRHNNDSRDSTIWTRSFRQGETCLLLRDPDLWIYCQCETSASTRPESSKVTVNFDMEQLPPDFVVPLGEKASLIDLRDEDWTEKTDVDGFFTSRGLLLITGTRLLRLRGWRTIPDEES